MTKYLQSRKSLSDYFKWRTRRVRPVVKKINKIKKLRGLNILEIGCGYGSLMALVNDLGANVIGTEASKESVEIAKKFLKGRKKVKVINVKDEKLDFQDSSFDVVVLFDVIEHVKNPEFMVKECIRVLKPGGILYSEFTPYYSLVGHHLYDVSKLPIHVLPERYIKKLVYGAKVKGIFNPDDYWRDFKSLNKLRISEFQKYVRSLSKIEEKYILKYPDVFEISVPVLALLGRFKDTFAFSFEGIYKKT